MVTIEALRDSLIPQVLAVIPADWRGTTFNNSILLGREAFSERLLALLKSKVGTALGGAGAITADELRALGNAEDYLRVATNLCTVYESVMAISHGMSIEQVFSFASRAMPVVAVAMTCGKPVHLYHGSTAAPFSTEECSHLALIGGDVTCHAGAPSRDAHPGAVVLALQAAADAAPGVAVDGLIGDCDLYIKNTSAIRPSAVLTIRKRLAIPATTPMCEARLQALCGQTPSADDTVASDLGIADFNAHLQTMHGTDVDRSANPVVFAAGLPAIASLWLTLIKQGGANILMCSTSYGGSSEVTDIFHARSGKLAKSTFDIQGDSDMIGGIQVGLDALVAKKPEPELLPTTVVFVEMPTNPDQKIPDLKMLTCILHKYQEDTGKQVLLLLDTTLAPSAEVLKKVKSEDPDLMAMAFVSLSKSVSRGITTAGALVANHIAASKDLVNAVRATSSTLDSTAKQDQMVRLCENHVGVEARCQSAYDVMVAVGNALCAAVKDLCQVDMPLSYVHSEHAAVGFTSSQFSFNLPSPEAATDEINAALAQRFVDLLTEFDPETRVSRSKLFKPCVSFGQDNGLVYCTVPATSTQGAIKAEDKAKQAKGGVQLVRLSFPPNIDVEATKARMRFACEAIYQSRKHTRPSSDL